jgi:molybdopterin converting factor small subunit
MKEPQVTVEFFGVPRARAGRAEMQVRATTAAEALAAVAAACPALSGVQKYDGSLAPHFLLSLGGNRFLTDLNLQLSHGDRLLLLSADAGG